jgi:hypothetical protein
MVNAAFGAAGDLRLRHPSGTIIVAAEVTGAAAVLVAGSGAGLKVPAATV